MKDDSHTAPRVAMGLEPLDVQKLAQRAISVLATNGSERNDRLSKRLAVLCDAYLGDDEAARHEALLRMRQDGIPPADIIDHIVPTSARIMGERWFRDDISFADVTIGAARLQETVRALGARSTIDAKGVAPLPRVLLIIPRSEHHTLGAFVAADQFRRLGFSVEVAIDQDPHDVAHLVRSKRFDMVGITASSRRSLASARVLVDTIRCILRRVTPIVIGGTVYDTDLDILGMTGADYIARDAQTALQMCGLSMAVVESSPK